MPKPTRHVFVCLHERPPDDWRGSCRQRGGAQVLDALRGALFERDLMPGVKATGTGCLGQCEAGTVVVVYPDNVWYTNVQLEDVKHIVEEHIVGGQPVERLLLPEGS